MCVPFWKSVANNSIVFLCTEYNSNRRIISLIHQLTSVVVDIHLHLTEVLMSQDIGFQVNQHKTFKNIVVKNKINEKVLSIQCESLLSGNKRKPTAKFQEELLEMVNKGLFQVTLINMGIWLNLEEFHYIRIFDDFFILRFWFRFLYLRCNSIFILAGYNTFKIHCMNLTFQLPYTP